MQPDVQAQILGVVVVLDDRVEPKVGSEGEVHPLAEQPDVERALGQFDVVVDPEALGLHVLRGADAEGQADGGPGAIVEIAPTEQATDPEEAALVAEHGEFEAVELVATGRDDDARSNLERLDQVFLLADIRESPAVLGRHPHAEGGDFKPAGLQLALVQGLVVVVADLGEPGADQAALDSWQPLEAGIQVAHVLAQQEAGRGLVVLLDLLGVHRHRQRPPLVVDVDAVGGFSGVG